MEQIGGNDVKKLLLEIDEKRKIMISIAKDSGLSNAKTIQCSQELDALLNQYERMKIDQAENARLSYIFLSKILNNMINSFTRYKIKKVING